jgi:hypothetical protein
LLILPIDATLMPLRRFFITPFSVTINDTDDDGHWDYFRRMSHWWLSRRHTPRPLASHAIDAIHSRFSPLPADYIASLIFRHISSRLADY